MQTIGNEINIFINAIGTGGLVCLVYNMLTLVQMLHKKNKKLICVEDMVYWCWVSVYVFWRIFQSTFGVIRWYILLGIVFGVWSTHTIWYSAKKVVNNMLKKLAKEPKSKYD